MSNDKYTKESGWILRQGEILSTADVVGELNALAKRVDELEAALLESVDEVVRLEEDAKQQGLRISSLMKAAAPSVESGAVPDARATELLERVQGWWHRADGDMPVSLEQDIDDLLSAPTPPASAEQKKSWAPCSPACDPEFGGYMDRNCDCTNSRAAKPVGRFNGKFEKDGELLKFEVRCYDSLPSVGAELYLAPHASAGGLDREKLRRHLKRAIAETSTLEDGDDWSGGLNSASAAILELLDDGYFDLKQGGVS